MQVNLFGVCTMIAELTESGGFTYYYRFEPMNLLGSLTGTALFLYACQALYLIFIIFFLVKEIRTFWKLRCKYLVMFWSWVEIQVIVLSIVGTVIFIYRYVATLNAARNSNFTSFYSRPEYSEYYHYYYHHHY